MKLARAIAYAAAGIPSTLAATPAPVCASLVDHQIRANPLTFLDHRRASELGGHISEHGHAEVLTVQIGMTRLASWIAQSSSRWGGYPETVGSGSCPRKGGPVAIIAS